MKLTRVSKIWIFALVTIEIIVFFATFFVLPNKIVSNVFFGISAVLLCGVVYQWAAFKALNGKVARKKIKLKERDYQLVEFYLDGTQKKNKDGFYKESDVILAKRVQGWTFIIVVFLATLVSAIVAIILGFAI